MSCNKSSYNAFKSVDELVSKPVIGSDGAALWQQFQSNTKHQSSSVAPNLPLKKVDRLGGITSLEQERRREEEIRQQSGKLRESQGYTVFRKTNTAEEAAARKKRKRIEERRRPEDKKYYIPSTTFEGSKFDYVFTTRDRGTGYYWDGMDSVKKSKSGDFVEENEVEKDDKETSSIDAKDEKPKKKRKKKMKQSTSPPAIVDDPNNPMNQVAEAIRRRNEALHAPPFLPSGWETATDSASGKTYYYCRATGERTWEKPTAPAVPTETNVNEAAPLPNGWSVAKDKSTGKEYYYHVNGQVKWERPT